jgi:hypothetical protein
MEPKGSTLSPVESVALTALQPQKALKEREFCTLLARYGEGAIVTTFTLRVSDSLAADLSSARMRALVDAFLRQPHPLPRDPGPGYERISLTLTETSVNAAAAYLQCSASSALRRIAIGEPGDPRRASIPNGPFPNMMPAPASIRRTTPNLALNPQRTETSPRGSASKGQSIAGALIQFLCSALFLGVWLFFISRKKKSAKGA